LYNIAAGTWSATTGGLNHVHGGGLTLTLLTNNKVLVVGGNAAGAGLGITELYDPVAGTFTDTTGTLPNTSLALFWHTSTLLASGKVLVAGGTDMGGTYYTACYLYDPTTQLWTATGSMATQRSEFRAALLVDGTVLVEGGYSNIVGGYRQKISSEIYDPVAATWSFSGNMTRSRFEFTATLLNDGSVLVVGGQSGPEFDFDGTPTAEIFGPGPPLDATALYILASGWPTLIDNMTDPTDMIVTNVVKDIIPYGSALVPGHSELLALNKYRSIQIVSSIDLSRLPSPDTYSTTRNISLPEQLISVGPIWDSSSSQGTSTDPKNFSGSVDATVSVHGTIVVVKKGGFRGAALARVERVFFFGPPPDASVPQPTIIRPSTGTAFITGQSVSGKLAGSTFTPPLCVAGANRGQPAQVGDIIGYDGVIGQANGLLPMFLAIVGSQPVTSGNSGSLGNTTQVVDVNNVLTAGIIRTSHFSADNSSFQGGMRVDLIANGNFSANIPPSCPSSIPAGMSILEEVSVEKWRLGLFVRTIVYVIAPGDCNA
jgi:hypothetical protein